MLRALLLLFVPSLAAAAPCEVTKAVLVDDGHAVVCVKDCWSFDLAARTWSPTKPPADKPAPPDSPTPPDLATFTTTLVPCKQCKELVAEKVKPNRSARADLNADGSLIAVQVTYRAVHVFDAKSEKRLATIKAWKTAMEGVMRSYELAGDRVVLYVADTPVSSAAKIYDARTGRLLAPGGDGESIADEADALGPDVRVFHKFDSGVRFVQSLRTGKILKRIDVGREPMLEAHAGTLLVATQGNGLTVYDAATNKQARYEVPACK